MSDRFIERIREWAGVERAEQVPLRIGVLVTPWISTPVPFFSMECALMLRRRGAKVTILWDSHEIVGNIPNKKHIAEIERVFPFLPEDLQPLEVSEAAAAAAPADAETAERIVHENAVRAARGEWKVAEFHAAHGDALEATAEHLARIRGALGSLELDAVLIPGGIFGVSAVYVATCRELGIGFSTFDSGPRRLRLVHDGVAGHLGDIPAVFAKMREELPPERRARAMAQAREELAARKKGTDERGFQVAAGGGGERCDILIPLNIRWDAAALSRQHLFATVADFLNAVLEWAIAQPGNLTVAVRQHPNERHAHLAGTDDVANIVQGHGPRARWIPAASAVNTYDLIEACRVVLPHTSTVGIEAAMLGRPAVLSTLVYYRTLPFAHAAESKEEFFAMIRSALDGRLAVSREDEESAAFAYFLTQKCSVAQSAVTPYNDDFFEWTAIPPDRLWSETGPAEFATALLTREPLAALICRRLLGS